MSSAGLNKWIVSGYLAADAQVKTVELRDGEKAQVANATLYVRKVKNRKESFTVSLSIWDNSAAWRKLPFLKKGSLIICTGSVEPSPYFATSDNSPRAGLGMTVLDIDLDNVRDGDEEERTNGETAQPAQEEQKPPATPPITATPTTATKTPGTTAKAPATATKATASPAKAPVTDVKEPTKA